MLRWIFQLVMTLLVVIVVIGLGFIYIMSTGAVSPVTETIDLEPVFSNRNSNAEKNWQAEQQHLLDIKKIAVENQAKQLEKKKELLLEKEKEIEQYLAQELARIKGRYQLRIDEFQRTLNEEFVEYKKDKEQEFEERLLVKKELYQEKLTDLIRNLEVSSVTELEQGKQDIIKDYYAEKLNYQLKLRVLDLSEEEKEEYENKLSELETQQIKDIQEKRDKISQYIENKIKEYEEQYNTNLKEYKRELQQEIETDIKQQQTINKKRLEDYVSRQQHLMDAEIGRKSRELRDRCKKEIVILKNIIDDMSDEYYRLQSELAILEKEVMD